MVKTSQCITLSESDCSCDTKFVHCQDQLCYKNCTLSLWEILLPCLDSVVGPVL